MADTINQIAIRLKEFVPKSDLNLIARLGESDSDDRPNAERTLSNTKLLLETLANFYGDPKSDFFPTSVTATIRDRLIQAEGTLIGLPTDGAPIPPDLATNLLKNLDELYAYCLQYGIISFGFTSKIASEQVDFIRRARQQAENASAKMLESVKRDEAKLIKTLDAFDNSLAAAEANFSAKVSERIDAIQPSIDSLSALLAAGQNDTTKIEIVLKAITEHANAAEQMRSDLDASTKTATAEIAAYKVKADAETASIQALGLQVQKFEADAKAMHQGVTDAKSKISEQMTEITGFYGEIEKHRSLMTEASKTSQLQFSNLLESTEKSVSNLRDRTGEIVTTNEAMIEQIKDHLRKAIGIGLFTAFDKRRKSISFASWVWAFLLLASVGGTIWFAIWFVGHITDIAGIADLAAGGTGTPVPSIQWTVVYARLIIVAPLAFLVAFSAKRYSSERRAEEEWAFKSAISISLEPFRDLIARMKEQSQETAFVEGLISEIFDNPAKRLYAVAPVKEAKGTNEMIDIRGIVKDVLDRIGKPD